MKKLHLAALTFILATVALKADNIVDEIIARVNDQIITRSEFEKAKTSRLEELKQSVPDWQSKWEQAQKEVLRDLIDRQLLLEKGKELGITGETETVKRLNQMRQQMGLASMDDLEAEAKKQGVQFEDFKEQIRTGVVTEKVIGQEVGSKIHITNEEVQEFYKQHQKELEGPEEVSLSEILISTQPSRENVQNKDNPNAAAQDKPLPEDPAKVAEAQKKAEDAEKTLQSGSVKFEDLAKKISEGSTAAQGGPLGTFKRGELAKEIEDATFSLKAGEYTKPIRTRQGFIIFKVNAHRSPGVPPLKEVEDRIREAIYSQKLEPAARAYLSKLREQAYIDVKPGYTDTGAVAGQGTNKPVMVAAAGDPASRQGKTGLKKKKKFLLF